MIVTITGANDLLRRGELDKLVQAFIGEHGDMAVERFDGEESAPERMRESVQSMPFLSPRKLVVLREPGKQKSFAEAITAVLESVADTTDLIIYEPKLDKRGSYYKTLKKTTDFRELGELDALGLSRWAVSYAQEQGGGLSQADARLLIDRIGINQLLLKSELDKLLAYDTQISRATIELLTEPLPQSTVFELLDAAFASNSAKAFAIYGEQRALKVEPQAIIAMLAWQLHILAVVKAAGQKSVDVIAKEAKLNPFVVRKSQGITRRLTLAQIKGLIGELLELDMRLKRSSIDVDEALQLYLLKLATS
ncbi:MAG TPA: DNA polymerase III subunit delta [Candidatus Saccharimonadales bacterium]|nr:DNA polymerase III subunit delta [Candidatus Saccharimonadales bacterium]